MAAFRPLKARRHRRPDDGKFLPKDEKAWRALIVAAAAQARAPLASSDPLIKAGDRVAQAVIPEGYRHRGSPFLSLAATARGWWRLSPTEREARGGELEGLAEACATALDAIGEREARPPRADVFG